LRYTPAFDNNDYLNRLVIQKNYVISWQVCYNK
jgi:hypothetical protein